MTTHWPEMVAGGIALAAVVMALRPLPVASISAARVEAAVATSFALPAADWVRRLKQDATIATCAEHRGAPGAESVAGLRETARRSIVYPAGGKLAGDWRRGEALAQSGYGLRFTDADQSRTNGGNCYACHRISPDETSHGTLGPSLEGYGKARGFTPETERGAYERIYNSHAFNPCSRMPRFGANGVLSPDQIADIVALLTDPGSPVNR